MFCIYIHVQIDNLILFDKKKQQEHPQQRDDASTADADPGRVGRDEQVETRPGNSAPKGGPQLELSREQLKIWSKSEPSAALLQPLENPSCIYQGGFAAVG